MYKENAYKSFKIVVWILGLWYFLFEYRTQIMENFHIFLHWIDKIRQKIVKSWFSKNCKNQQNSPNSLAKIAKIGKIGEKSRSLAQKASFTFFTILHFVNDRKKKEIRQKSPRLGGIATVKWLKLMKKP